MHQKIRFSYLIMGHLNKNRQSHGRLSKIKTKLPMFIHVVSITRTIIQFWQAAVELMK